MCRDFLFREEETNDDGAHLAFASSLFAKGKTEEAIAHARAAVEIRPANAGAYGEMPVGLEGEALDQAILLCRAQLEDDPNNIGAYTTPLGFCWCNNISHGPRSRNGIARCD